MTITSRIFPLFIISLVLASLTACGGGGGGGDSSGGGGATSTDYPHLLSAPRITYEESVYQPGMYDVTVRLDATGPQPIYAVSLWIFPEDDSDNFMSLDLQYLGGTTWEGSSYYYLPFPPGNYYVDNAMIQDADPFEAASVRSGWYLINQMVSNSHYYVDQRLTVYDPELAIAEFNSGLSNIPIVRFTLP